MPVGSVNFVRLRCRSLATSFIASTSSSGVMPAARPSADGARLSDAMSMARRRSLLLNTLRISSRVLAPPRACLTSTRVISVQPSRSRPFLRTAMATKILVVDAIARISSASLLKISAPVSRSITTAVRDLTSGGSASPAYEREVRTPTITHRMKGRIMNEVTRCPTNRDFSAACELV
jgi:hypothetical protein